MAIRREPCRNCGANISASVFANDPWCSDNCKKIVIAKAQAEAREALNIIRYGGEAGIPTLNPNASGVIRSEDNVATQSLIRWVLHHDVYFMSFRAGEYRYFVVAPTAEEMLVGGRWVKEVLSGTPAH